MSEIRWRPTRLEAEDKATLSKAVAEEVPGQGWRWRVYRGSRLSAAGERCGKGEALAQADQAMRSPPRGVS